MDKLLKWLPATLVGLTTLACAYSFFRYSHGVMNWLPGIPALMIMAAITMMFFASAKGKIKL